MTKRVCINLILAGVVITVLYAMVVGATSVAHEMFHPLNTMKSN